MIRPLRKYHRITWIILAFLLLLGFVASFILSRKFEKFYDDTSMKDYPSISNMNKI